MLPTVVSDSDPEPLSAAYWAKSPESVPSVGAPLIPPFAVEISQL